LASGGGVFLDRLGRMHEGGGRGRICVIAVDESHCVSEWVRGY
jgi:superfamily II DNA helicase RecQ